MEGKAVGTDVTIYLDDPILSRGGTVVVLPYAVSSYVTVPAKMNENGEKVTFFASVSSTVSVVRFNYIETESYVFRFAPKNSAHPRANSVMTKLLSYGSASNYDETINAMVEFTDFQAFAVTGELGSEAQSRKDESDIFEYLNSGKLNCTSFLNDKTDLQVCGLKDR
jgi:hypothetical protein